MSLVIRLEGVPVSEDHHVVGEDRAGIVSREFVEVVKDDGAEVDGSG